jgi:hypothetical protein
MPRSYQYPVGYSTLARRVVLTHDRGMAQEKTPVAAIIRVLGNKKGSAVARVHVMADSGFDVFRLKNYAFMAWSSLSAHGFKPWEIDIDRAVWHPDRSEYLFDTAFAFCESAEKGGAWVMLVKPTFKTRVIERLPSLLKALILPMSHPSVKFTPRATTNILELRKALARKAA